MEKSGFFNANQIGETYDRIYFAEDFATYFASFIANGVFPIPSDGLQALATGGREVIIKTGRAWIDGYFYENTDNLYHDIVASDGTLNRVDVFVVRLTYSDRAIRIYLIKGTPAVTPVPYVPVRNADMYELVIARVLVNKGTVDVKQADIIDTRLDNNVCGIVHGLVDQVDTTTIFNQFQDYYNSKVSAWNQQMLDQQKSWSQQTTKQQGDWTKQTTLQQGEWSKQMVKQQEDYDTQEDRLEADFVAWFETIKDILDGEVAGKLLNMIMEHEANQEIHVNAIYKSRWNNVALDATAVYSEEDDTYTLTLTNPPEIMPSPANVRWISERFYEIGQMFKLNDIIYDTKYAAFEEGDVVTAQFYDGIAYFSSGSGSSPAPDVGIAKVKITSHDGLNLNRAISYVIEGGETKTAQVDDTGVLLLTLAPATYTFRVTSVPSGYRTPSPVIVTVVAGRRAAVNMFLAFTAIDEDKTKVVIDVTTFDDTHKEGLSVTIGTEIVLTDAEGHVEKILPAYSAPQTLAQYVVSVVPDKGYKKPLPITLTASPAAEISTNFHLEEQLIEPDKTVVTVKVTTFDDTHKENLTVNVGSNIITTNAAGVATITLPAFVEPVAEPPVLMTYEVKVVPDKGYKPPAVQVVDAIAGDEILVSKYLEEQIAPDGKCIINIQVIPYDDKNKENIEVDVDGVKYYTDINGHVEVMVDAI